MSALALKTVKRLFALSKNRCAYPKCYNAIVDNDGIILGDICHIKAANHKGHDTMKTRFQKTISHLKLLNTINS